MSLRRLNGSHAEAVLDLLRTYRTFTYNNNKLESLLDAYPAYGLFNQSGQLDGFAYTEYFAPDMIEIGNLFVRRESRDGGLGALLLQAIEEASKELGHKAIVLSNSMLYGTKEKKRPADSFYAKCGYTMIFGTEDTKIYTKRL